MAGDRFDKFTERARKVLQYAQEEAQKFGEGYVSTEHLLLGLVREDASVAAKVLQSIGISLARMRSPRLLCANLERSITELASARSP